MWLGAGWWAAGGEKSLDLMDPWGQIWQELLINWIWNMKKRETLSTTLRLLAWDMMMPFTEKEKAKVEACGRGRRKRERCSEQAAWEHGHRTWTVSLPSRPDLHHVQLSLGSPGQVTDSHSISCLCNTGRAKPPLRFVRIRKRDVCVHPVNYKGAEWRFIFLFPLLFLVNVCLNDT